jgi:hypothetical protein
MHKYLFVFLAVLAASLLTALGGWERVEHPNCGFICFPLWLTLFLPISWLVAGFALLRKINALLRGAIRILNRGDRYEA